jgi:hypothetical protein
LEVERVNQSEEEEKEEPEMSREDTERDEELDTGEQEGIKGFTPPFSKFFPPT